LGKTIHPLLNLNVDPTVRIDNVTKVVVDDDFVGYDVKMEAHELEVWHGGVEVEVGEVDAQKCCPRGAECGIDGGFGRDEISHWCTFAALIVNAIAAGSESNAMLLFFLRSIIAAYAAVGGTIVSWNLRFGDEQTCVSAGDVSDTLEELPKFVGKTVCPNMPVFAQFHQVMVF
jgi:hypothetical protein